MASLNLSHIYKVYPNGKKAVDDFSMDIADKEFIVFVGPSGCGKSTTLRMIAGLEEITAGELRIDGVVVNDVEPKDRDIAMVFQNYALYPHMTVYQNMAFGLKLRKLGKEDIDLKVREAAEILGITEYLDKKPKEMSGGQRQRVALGRAIVRNPKVMLLDEPLSNLDAKLRTAMRSEISKLHHKLQTTFIYVTHDQVEAMTMGTRIVVMKDGVIQQIDTPRNLYRFPCNKFVAGFIGTPQMNFFEGRLLQRGDVVNISLDNTAVSVDAPIGLFDKTDRAYLNGDKKVFIGLRAEHISVDPDAHPYRAKCRVSHVEELGTDCQVYADFDLDGSDTVAESPTRVIVKAPAGSWYDADSIIDVSLDLDHMHLFDTETENTVAPRIPEEVVVDGRIEGGKLSLLGSEILLPSAFDASEGDVKVHIPTNAVRLGGDIAAVVREEEDVNGRILVHLQVGDRVLFALCDEHTSQEQVTADIDLKSIALERNGETVQPPLDLVNSLPARLSRRKATAHKQSDGKTAKGAEWEYTLTVAGYDLNCSAELAQKLIVGGGKNIFDKDLDVQFDPYTATVGEDGIAASVLRIADYGRECFAVCAVGDNTVNVSVPKGFDGKELRLVLRPEQLVVMEKARGIRLA